MGISQLTGDRITAYEWITLEIIKATAHSQMIDHVALCILTAHTRTRIGTFRIDASLVGRAIGVLNTFRTTTRVRIALITKNATASSIVASSIGSTR